MVYSCVESYCVSSLSVFQHSRTQTPIHLTQGCGVFAGKHSPEYTQLFCFTATNYFVEWMWSVNLSFSHRDGYTPVLVFCSEPISVLKSSEVGKQTWRRSDYCCMCCVSAVDTGCTSCPCTRNVGSVTRLGKSLSRRRLLALVTNITSVVVSLYGGQQKLNRNWTIPKRHSFVNNWRA